MERGQSVKVWIDRITAQFEAGDLHFGHGTDTARDEAAWLVLHAVGAPLDGSFDDWGRAVGEAEGEHIRRIADERCESRQPLAYLLGSAWFAGLEFEVGPDVLVPRSPIAELILDGFRPWLRPERIRRVLDLGTGCGCIGIAAACHLPDAEVDAVDISEAALAVAARNAARHGVAQRVRLIRSDLFRSLAPCGYDLILANPPYVPRAALAGLPPEFRAEPGLGLASGPDGLDATLRILADAPEFLAGDGILICEVGESEERLAAALPTAPFLWLEFERGGTGVFLLSRTELETARPAAAALIGKRKHVA
jgi:ribosomal protein L3 glutamine methyltransferase